MPDSLLFFCGDSIFVYKIMKQTEGKKQLPELQGSVSVCFCSGSLPLDSICRYILKIVYSAISRSVGGFRLPTTRTQVIQSKNKLRHYQLQNLIDELQRICYSVNRTLKVFAIVRGHKDFELCGFFFI